MAQTRNVVVQFPRGATHVTKSGRIRGDESVQYVVNVRAGQRLAVSMSSDNGMAYFNVLPPGSREAIFIGPGEADPSFDRIVERSGNHVIDVYLIRAAARRGETAKYDVNIEVTGGSQPSGGTAKGDYADSLAGGPDFWMVTGVQGKVSGNRLQAHSQPGKNTPVTASFVEGTPLRNLGCRMERGERWCRVAMRGDESAKGWVLGGYLKELAE
jgi:hypothetical protein